MSKTTQQQFMQINECDGNRGLVQSTGCTFSIPDSVGLVNSSSNKPKTSLRGLHSAEAVSGISNSNQTSLNQNQSQIITGTNIDLIVDKPVDESVTATTHVNSRYLQYKEPLSYKQAMTFSDRNEWQEATDKELQQFSDLEAMLPIKLNEVPEGANITKQKNSLQTQTPSKWRNWKIQSENSRKRLHARVWHRLH